MAINEVKITADSIKKKKSFSKIVKVTLLVILFFLTFLFIILSIIYKGGNFIITLDPSFASEQGIRIFEELEYKDAHPKLYAKSINNMDNISIKWLPENINDEGEGSHNGDNYIAYTFYVENSGIETVNYWYEIVIDDVIKNVDDAVRIMIIQNGEKKIYAKKSINNEPEPNTIEFYSKDIAVLQERKDFYSKDIDKYTIVIWIEGDDPECVNNIIGGEIKMHMEIRNEHFVD